MARSLEVLLGQINDLFPNRDKSSDGGIGNAEHASRSSDHNPWVTDGTVGVVTARDFTNDPANGMDSEVLANALLASHDPRIKYVISNRKIASGLGEDHPAWVWRPYTGANPHNHHCHVSVKANKQLYDSEAKWNFTMAAAPLPAVQPGPPTPTLRQGAKGDAVIDLQRLLNAKGAFLKIDGDFGKQTHFAVMTFQKMNNLVADGVVGRYTWEKLRGL